MLGGISLEAATHLIQTALTPVFLLSGIGTLLNVFAGRLARVADQADALTKTAEPADALTKTAGSADGPLRLLRRRALILDVAVVLASVAAALTCLAILALFLFELSNYGIAGLLLTLFGLAVISTLGSVLAFGLEMLLSNRALRRRISFHLPHIEWTRPGDR